MTKSEAQTRSELIDQQLAQSSWDVKDPTQVIEEFDILTALPEGVADPRTPYEDHQFSDYVLLGKDRKPLARTVRPPDIVQKRNSGFSNSTFSSGPALTHPAEPT